MHATGIPRRSPCPAQAHTSACVSALAKAQSSKATFQLQKQKFVFGTKHQAMKSRHLPLTGTPVPKGYETALLLVLRKVQGALPAETDTGKDDQPRALVLPISETDRQCLWPLGPRPDAHSALTELGLQVPAESVVSIASVMRLRSAMGFAATWRTQLCPLISVSEDMPLGRRLLKS